MPIVVVSARGQETDKVEALGAGADDYLTKPFGTGELLARMRVALRHSSRVQDSGEPVVEAGGRRIDLGARVVYRNGEEVRLALLFQPGIVITSVPYQVGGDAPA